MQNTNIKRSKKSGLAPGALVHIGERKTEKTKIENIIFNETNYSEKELENIDDIGSINATSWINIDGLHETAILEKVGQKFDIHPLALEDILNTDQRPKTDEYKSNILIILKMLSLNNSSHTISEQVSFILGENYLISFQEGLKGDVFNPVRDRIKSNKGKIRGLKADYLLYSLIDAVVDNYFLVTEKIGEKIELLQNELLKSSKHTTLNKIYDIKHEVMFLRKAIWPLREVIGTLEKSESRFINENTKLHFRDIYDHAIQIMDTIESYREILSSLVEIYLTSITNKTNEVMKTLTVIATIFMPATFIVGIYGMNFKYMPELSWHYGYFITMLLILIITISMLSYFKKKKWF